MERDKGQIGLNTATRRKPEADAFDYRPASVEQWVKHLPVGNVGETSRQVYEGLREVNRLAITWKERYRFLELLREPLHYIQSSLVRRYTGVTLPLHEKSRRTAALAKTLYNEMALGYKTAIEEMLAHSFLSRDNKAMRVMIHRAIRYLSQALLTCYQTYTPHPEQSWFELHSLYLYAELKGLHQDPVKDEYNSLMTEASIARVYKQILMLALASPYRLRQGESESLYEALARWAGHAHIVAYNDPSASEALFVVHMDSDEAPDYQAFNHRDCSTELCRLVDTRQLSRVLHDELEELIKRQSKGPISTDLMQRLIRTWGVAPKRSFSRNDSNDSITVVVGLLMFHRTLSHSFGDKRLQGKRASFESHNVESINMPSNDDIWNTFSSDKVKKHYEEYELLSSPHDENEGETLPEPELQSWHIRNESAGGYRLAHVGKEGTRVQVGELLGLCNPSHNNAWEIGVIRWIRQDGSGHIEVGVQVLAPQARPVMVKNRQAGGKAGEFQYALLLPELSTIKQPATLITPAMLFEEGQELSLQLPGHDLKIRLMEKMHDSGSFTQYRYNISSAPRPSARPLPVSKETTWDESSFDYDWGDL